MFQFDHSFDNRINVFKLNIHKLVVFSFNETISYWFIEIWLFHLSIWNTLYTVYNLTQKSPTIILKTHTFIISYNKKNFNASQVSEKIALRSFIVLILVITFITLLASFPLTNVPDFAIERPGVTWVVVGLTGTAAHVVLRARQEISSLWVLFQPSTSYVTSCVGVDVAFEWRCFCHSCYLF